MSKPWREWAVKLMLRWEVINKLKEDIQNMKSRMNLKGNLIRTSGNQSDRRLHKTEGRHLLWAHIICHFSLSVPKRQSPSARDHHLGQSPSARDHHLGQFPLVRDHHLRHSPLVRDHQERYSPLIWDHHLGQSPLVRDHHVGRWKPETCPKVVSNSFGVSLLPCTSTVCPSGSTV